MMLPRSQWDESFRVKTYEVDFQGKWKPSNIFLAMQEAACRHADHLGVGYDDLQKKNLAWVLSRVKVYFHKYPGIGEQISLSTWPKGIQQKIFFMRDFDICNANGDQLATATTAWLLIDTQKKRMVPPAILDDMLPDNGGLHAVDEMLEKIPVVENPEERLVIEAHYSDVDILGHVNNARYVEWISNCFSLDEHQMNSLDWLQVNYSNEVRPGEKVGLEAGQVNGGHEAFFVQGVNLTRDVKAFEALLGWK